MPPHPSSDPVLVNRARMGRLAMVGQRFGYAMFGVAIAVFVYGAIAGFSSAIAIAVVVALAAGSVVLAPAIVLGYAVKAAAREDRERSGGGGHG
jgi:hypothetical protein